MQNLTQTTIQISDSALRKGVVLLGIEEYRNLQTQTAPTIYLTGKKAAEADRLVEEGLREYQGGKMIQASSLREAMQKYGIRKRKKDILQRKVS